MKNGKIICTIRRVSYVFILCAAELAVNNKLWGHAFLLASKMGPKYDSNVLAKFDASISVNNPLKTLYQLHSNQIPLAATVSFRFI